MRPMSKINIKWSSGFAYAIGLIATDGNLSPDGRHISFTSKDKELVDLFLRSLHISSSIGKKARGGEIEKKYFVVQIGDVLFYKFLVSIGITPKKSKTISEVKVPKKYFYDFLRGHFDGDGTFYSYWDKRWKSSFMFYMEFISASENHIQWLQKAIQKEVNIHGHITRNKRNSVIQLKYAKAESLKLIRKMYYDNRVPCLSRKRDKIMNILARVVKLVDTPS